MVAPVGTSGGCAPLSDAGHGDSRWRHHRSPCMRDPLVTIASSTGAPSRSPRALVRCDHRAMPRFLTLADVAEILNVSAAQAYALVRSGEVPAIQVGGRGQWRIEEQRLEDYISAKYAETAARFIDA